MKIGEISRFCDVSKDTIRYYISLGFLAPRRRNAQYRFSQRDIDDLLYIQRLKGMQFSLKDIESIMRMRSTSNWVEPSTIAEYSLMLRSQRGELITRQTQLQASADMIDRELDQLSRRLVFKHSDTGVPLRALPYLACPRCGEPLPIEGASFSHKYVHNGLLGCGCGYSATIENGVLLTGNRYMGSYDSPDLERRLYRTLSSDLLRIYHGCSGYIAEQLHALSLSDRVVLEGNINGYFFLYNHFADLPKDCLYVIVDKFPETVAMYKGLIEQLNLDLDILYIADASFGYPLRAGCVDVCLDFFGSNEQQFYHEDGFVHAVAPFLSERALVVGSYMELDSRAQSRRLVTEKYPESSRRVYSFTPILAELKDLGFEIRTQEAGTLTKTQNEFSFSCHLEGDEMRFYSFTAGRRPGPPPAGHLEGTAG